MFFCTFTATPFPLPARAARDYYYNDALEVFTDGTGEAYYV